MPNQEITFNVYVLNNSYQIEGNNHLCENLGEVAKKIISKKGKYDVKIISTSPDKDSYKEKIILKADSLFNSPLYQRTLNNQEFKDLRDCLEKYFK